MNESIFRAINDFAGRWGWLDMFMVFSAEYLWYVMILAVLVYAIWNYRRYRDMVIVAIGSAIIARFGLAALIRHFYYHARPYWIILKTNLLLAREAESSFPSGHTIFIFALATGVYQYNKKAGLWFYVLACLVGFSRIFVGVHWPYDIITGAILGVITAYFCSWLYRKYKYLIHL
jgi:undecaprenyl-diphosphatase